MAQLVADLKLSMLLKKTFKLLLIHWADRVLLLEHYLLQSSELLLEIVLELVFSSLRALVLFAQALYGFDLLHDLR